MSEANKALSRRWAEEVMNKKNLALIDELVAPNFVRHDPAMADMQGPAGLKQLVTMIHTAFPDVHYTIEDLVAEGEKVVTRWTARGTHKGEFMGVAPTGKQATVTGTGTDRIVNGKLQEAWEHWDALGLMQQLGAVPPLGQGAT